MPEPETIRHGALISNTGNGTIAHPVAGLRDDTQMEYRDSTRCVVKTDKTAPGSIDMILKRTICVLAPRTRLWVVPGNAA